MNNMGFLLVFRGFFWLVLGDTLTFLLFVFYWEISPQNKNPYMTPWSGDRFEPRVEVEAVSSRLSVVHNYGHCGYGVLSSPGTSQQAASLVNNILSQHT